MKSEREETESLVEQQNQARNKRIVEFRKRVAFGNQLADIYLQHPKMRVVMNRFKDDGSDVVFDTLILDADLAPGVAFEAACLVGST